MSDAPTLIERAADDLDGAGPGGLAADIFSGAVSGVIVRGALAPAQCADVIARLSQQPGVAAPPFPGTTYGQVLVVSEDLPAYHQAARDLERQLADLPALAEITAVLQRLAGGRPTALVRSPLNQLCAPVTVRLLPPGQAVAVHSEHARWAGMAAHASQMDLSTQLSFYLPLQTAEAGGELVLFHPPPPDARRAMEQLPFARAHEALEPHGFTAVPVGVGDLIMFDGGRWNHRVTTVRGDRTRWTIGGFAAPGPSQLFHWS